MKQPRHGTLANLLAGGFAARAGAELHGASLGLLVGTASEFDLAIDALVAARDAHAFAHAELAAKRKLLKSRMKATSDLMTGSRDLLKRTLGTQYSTRWIGTGFKNSLSLPRSLAPLQNVTGTFKAYIEAHPELEVSGLMTAAMIGASLDELNEATDAVTLQAAETSRLRTARLAAEKALRLLLRWTVQELGRKLDALDSRWIAFGFNKPGAKETPEAPQNVKATVFGDNALAVEWDKTPRASHYRIYMKVIGVDADHVPVGSAFDPNFTREGLPANALVEVFIMAVNDGGESGPSVVVQMRIGTPSGAIAYAK